MREKKPPKTLKCMMNGEWWTHPDMWTIVFEFYNKKRGFYECIRVGDLFDSIEEAEKLREDDPHEFWTIREDYRIKRALYQKTGAKYEPVGWGIEEWVRED